MEPRHRFQKLLEDLSAEWEAMTAENDRLRQDVSRSTLPPIAAQLHVASTPEAPEPAVNVLADCAALPGQPSDPDGRSHPSPSSPPKEAEDDHEESAVRAPTTSSRLGPGAVGQFARESHPSPSSPPKEAEDDDEESAVRASTKSSRLGPGAIGQFTREATRAIATAPATKRPSMRFCVDNIALEAGLGILILLNTLMLVVEMQITGVHLGQQLECGSCPMDSSLAMSPHEAKFFSTCEFVFGILFTIELVIKVIALKRDFARSWWNLLDSLIVVLWICEHSARLTAVNPMVLRLVRMGRLCRLGRVLRTIQMFDSLNVLTGSIQACMPALFWSICLLLLVQVSVALVLQAWLEPFIMDESVPAERRVEVHRYFGTFTRSMITMFELSLANWAPACRLLMENVHESYGILVLAFKLVVGFAVVNVISGVFLHETFRVTSTDDDLMVVQKSRAAERHLRKMAKLLREADESHDGVLQREEFRGVLRNPSIRRWLEAMDIEVADVDVLFDFLANGRDELTARDLVHGMSRLKGSARSIDLVGLVQRVLELQGRVEDIAAELGRLQPNRAPVRSDAEASRTASKRREALETPT